MKIAIVHEWLNTYRGAERLLVEILKIYPQAEILALIHNKQNLLNTPLEAIQVKTSFLQKIPHVEHLYRGLLPFMPLAIESMNVRQYDVVISISHAVSHGIRTSKDQIHIAYVCTPMRYAWHLQDDYLHLHHLDKPIIGSAARLILNLMRHWDKTSSARTDHVLAISDWTAQKIRQAWGMESKVIHPPVDVSRFHPANKREGYYLHVSHLVPYKMTAEIIRAFNELNLPLVIIGDGPELPNLQKLAKENIKLLGHQSDEVVADFMNKAKAFVYMAVEDFGIVMVEAQAAGCPVIAYEKGGAAEIVRDGETGLLFNEQSALGLSRAILQFQDMKIKSKSAHQNAVRFSSERFKDEFSHYMKNIINK